MRRAYGELLVPEPPAATLRVSVIVPARNEEQVLPSALQALAEQKGLRGAPLPYDCYEIILLINNTSDRSRQVAFSFQRLFPRLRLHVVDRTLDKSHAHAGHVRRLLMDEACRRLQSVSEYGLILSTDADTRVAPNWIARNREEISRGADAVGGRITVLRSEQNFLTPAAQQSYRLDHLYRRLVCWMEDRYDPEPHDPWPRHHQHFGASLAITPRAYRAAGRLPPRRCLEDVAFYDALVCHDIRIRHSNAVRVFTSGRLSGRTRFGLSRQLMDWQSSRKRLLHMPVESAAFLRHLFTTRAVLRNIWLHRGSTQEISRSFANELSAALQVPANRLLAAARASRFFGELICELRFYERCRAAWPDWTRVTTLIKAVQEMQAAFVSAQRTGTSHTYKDSRGGTSCEMSGEAAGSRFAVTLPS